jgi:hypothetical protein
VSTPGGGGGAAGARRRLIRRLWPGESNLEVVFWESIRESENAANFEAYLSQFPYGTFGALARNRLEELAGTESAVLVVPPVVDFEMDTLDQDHVMLKNANVRAGPSIDTKKIASLPAGTMVTVTGKVTDAEWYRVALPYGGVGYVWALVLGMQELPEELRSSKPAATQSAASLDGVYEAIVPSCHQPSSGSGVRNGGGLARTPAERHFSARDVYAGRRDDGGADPDRRLG